MYPLTDRGYESQNLCIYLLEISMCDPGIGFRGGKIKFVGVSCDCSLNNIKHKRIMPLVPTSQTFSLFIQTVSK